MQHRILAVDQAWTPDKWLSPEDALSLYTRGLVDYSLGETVAVLRGGMNAQTGKQSILELNSILVIDTRGHMTQFDQTPNITREMLFQRDRCTCAYCGGVFKSKDLTFEHIHPASRGGRTTWSNIVSACVPCNQRKADRRPEEAGMELLYIPYRPTRHEHMILQNRHIRTDQMKFLMEKVPEHSRLRN